MHFELEPHPDTGRSAVSAISVDVSRQQAGALSLRYELSGAIANLLIPAPATPERADELWKHACFEAFLQRPGESAYREFNFSPSTQWAAYAFDGHREGMRVFAIPAPQITLAVSENSLVIEALIEALGDDAWRLALSAVIEETDGRKSYWALKHPPGRPDFHHPDCFAAELGPSERS